MGKTYTPYQIAKKTKYSDQTIRIYCQKGLIPGAYKEDDCWLIPEETAKNIFDAIDNHVPLNRAFVKKQDSRPSNKYCSIYETSKMSGWSESYLQDQCLHHNVPGAIKIGRRWYIPRDTAEICKKVFDGHGTFENVKKDKYISNTTFDELDDFIDVYTAAVVSGLKVETIRYMCHYHYLIMENGMVSKESLRRYVKKNCNKSESLPKSQQQPEPEAPVEAPEPVPEPEPQPPTPVEPEPSAVSSATIQGHEIRLESVDAFDLFTQAYDALFLLSKVLGGRTDKDMTAAYTEIDDIRKNLALHRSDIEAINDYTYTLVYLDGSPSPAAFPVRKQGNEGAVA